MHFKKIYLVFILGILGNHIFGQDTPLNAELVAHVPFNENSSGIWGYQDQNGLKYAVIGTASATRVFSLEDPSNPIERYVAPGTVGIWREVRYYKNYIYASTDQGADGLLVIDMTNAPTTITSSFYKPEITVGEVTKNLGRCHNIFIDEKGFCYLSGCNISKRGVLIFDLNQNPVEPPMVGYSDLAYSHDVYARGDTVYNSEILDGRLAIYDVKDKADIKLLATQTTGRNFTHNAWTTDDAKYVFTTDERANAYVESYDISDFNNIKFLDRYRNLRSEDTGVIPHNTYYKNGYLITSYYTDGVSIIDAHKPDNLIEVAHYDTWDDPKICHQGFYGCWGVFPLDDGPLVYASDINNGLYILKFDYKRACYFEGQIKNTSGVDIPNVTVVIQSDQLNREKSNEAGQFKTGQVLNGTFKAIFTHPDYLTQEATIELKNGETTTLNVVLEPKKNVSTIFDIKDLESNPVSVNILLKDQDGFSTSRVTPSNGTFNTLIPEGRYEMIISAWGYKTQVYNNIEFEATEQKELKIDLVSGYDDLFESDHGWTVNSTPGTTGIWTRAKPRQTTYFNTITNPGEDSNDAGSMAFVTGNGNQGGECDDVDNGSTFLISPMMDLSSFSNPLLKYDVWFVNVDPNFETDDTLLIKVVTPQQEIVVDKIFGDTDGWITRKNIDIESFISLSDSMQIVAEVFNIFGQNQVTEAGFDQFSILESVTSTFNEEPTKSAFTIFPNPSSDQLVVDILDKKNMTATQLKILDLFGKVIYETKIDFHINTLDISTLAPGMYVVDILGFRPMKFIKK